jgi:RNA-directed DNA polymerase
MATDLNRMMNEEDLAVFLECSCDLAQQLSHATSSEIFRKHQIPKPGKAGEFREVWEVIDGAVADVFKNLARTLESFFRKNLPGYPHPAAHGYVRRRSILTNAKAHAGAARILKADVRRFFRSIGCGMVERTLVRAGMIPRAASVLSSVLVWEGHTPLGLHTSPTLANAVFLDLDIQFARLVAAGTYTRYGDDLTFSGPHLPEKESVVQLLEHGGFELAEEKWRVMRRGRGLFVTGLSLEDGSTPRVPKAMKRRLRQEIHHVSRAGIEQHAGRRGYGSVQSAINTIHGTIQYVRGIERERGDAFNRAWSEALAKEGIDPAIAASGYGRGRDALFLVDESTSPNGKTLMLCLIVVEDPDLIRRRLRAFEHRLLARPYAANVERLQNEGIHWNAMDHDDRTKAVETLIGLTFKAFVAYATLPSGDRKVYADVYRRLLVKLLAGRLVKFGGAKVVLKAEANSRISESLLEEAMSGAYANLAKTGSRRPISVPPCELVNKGGDEALPLPDLVLGVVSEFAWAGKPKQNDGSSQSAGRRLPGEQARRRFFQIQSKLKALYDLDGDRVFSRRNPFDPGVF